MRSLGLLLHLLHVKIQTLNRYQMVSKIGAQVLKTSLQAILHDSTYHHLLCPKFVTMRVVLKISGISQQLFCTSFSLLYTYLIKVKKYIFCQPSVPLQNLGYGSLFLFRDREGKQQQQQCWFAFLTLILQLLHIYLVHQRYTVNV